MDKSSESTSLQESKSSSKQVPFIQTYFVFMLDNCCIYTPTLTFLLPQGKCSI